LARDGAAGPVRSPEPEIPEIPPRPARFCRDSSSRSCPDPDLAGIGVPGFPTRKSRFGRDQEKFRPRPMPWHRGFRGHWARARAASFWGRPRRRALTVRVARCGHHFWGPAAASLASGDSARRGQRRGGAQQPNGGMPALAPQRDRQGPGTSSSRATGDWTLSPAWRPMSEHHDRRKPAGP
jgi:hypothetical protein